MKPTTPCPSDARRVPSWYVGAVWVPRSWESPWLLGRGEAALPEESGSVQEHGVVSEALHKGLPVAAF